MREGSITASVVLLSFLLVLLSFLPTLLTPSAASPEGPGTGDEVRDLCACQVFYGYASDMDGAWEGDASRWLHVIGLENNTTVYLYNITETPSLVANVTVDRMGVQRWYGAAEVPEYFKIVADKPVVATVFVAHDIPTRSYATFYPTVDGGFMGREFIFEAHRGTDPNPFFGGDFNASIFAIEDATVNIYDATDTPLSTFSMTANKTAKYNFATLTVYHVNSTGDIMIRQSPMEDLTMSPSTSGNFVGKMHFGSCPTAWGIWVIAYEPGTIYVYNLTVAGGIFNTSLASGYTVNHTFTKAGEYWNITGSITGGFDFLTMSTGNVSVGSGFMTNWGSLGYPGYIGGKYNATVAEYWVWGSQTWGWGNITIFAHNDTAFTVNGAAYTLKADEHLVISPPDYPGAVYHIVSDNPLTIISLCSGGHWGSYLSSMVYFAVDTTPPNIVDVSQIPLRDNVLPEDEVKVNATVIDDLSGVKQVILNYTNGNGTWITVNMTNLVGNVWNATIPAFPYCTNVTYVVIAEDNDNNTITTQELGYDTQYHVIPEFPTWTSMLLILIVLTVAIAICKRRLLKTPIH